MLILKVTHQPPYPGHEDGPHSVYSDVISAHFNPSDYTGGQIRAYIRDLVKTGEVSGFVEHERLIDVGPGCAVYVLNERGQTVSRFIAYKEAGKFEPVPVPT